MAIIRSSLSFLLGAACGVYAAQNYSVPNLRKLADTAMVFAKHYEESRLPGAVRNFVPDILTGSSCGGGGDQI
ncbi:hypothetical protein OPV22_022120 [Ensete ventricosum]|uniref:Uncharacterized protein n=1 Tax=Ensete ventricosum TaxID=4639 RepID=A0AAV8QTU0_ENSVE|nr:hypothetical protein OPV22_022120 [Ensete ventricosum]